MWREKHDDSATNPHAEMWWEKEDANEYRRDGLLDVTCFFVIFVWRMDTADSHPISMDRGS
jgi:hypothetical protein